MRFKVGDKVIKARRYSSTQYCYFGGDESDVPIGTRGVISDMISSDISVIFSNQITWRVDELEIDLEINGGTKMKFEFETKNTELITILEEISEKYKPECQVKLSSEDYTLPEELKPENKEGIFDKVKTWKDAIELLKLADDGWNGHFENIDGRAVFNLEFSANSVIGKLNKKVLSQTNTRN